MTAMRIFGYSAASSRNRTVLLAGLAVALVAVAALAGFGWARSQALTRAAETGRINGAARDCGAHRAVQVSMSFDGPGPVRFFLDGAGLARRTRSATDGPDRTENLALLPAAAGFPRCDHGSAHRYQTITADPEGCHWSVQSQATQGEALGHQFGLQASGTDCTFTLD
jgi:hypothetical protein